MTWACMRQQGNKLKPLSLTSKTGTTAARSERTKWTQCQEHLPHHVVTRRKQHRPGIASNMNTMLVTTARSSAGLTKRNHSPMRYNLAKDTTTPQTDSPQATSSQRTHIARTQGCGRMHPVNRLVTTQNLHTQSVTTRRRCGRDGKHEAPCELSAHRGISIATDQVESTVSGAVSGARNGVRLGAMEGWRHGRGAGGLGAVM